MGFVEENSVPEEETIFSAFRDWIYQQSLGLGLLIGVISILIVVLLQNKNGKTEETSPKTSHFDSDSEIPQTSLDHRGVDENPYLNQTRHPTGPIYEGVEPYPFSNTESRLNPQTSSRAQGSISSFRRKDKIPDTFSGEKSDLRDWLCHFEIVSRWNEWTEREKGCNLAGSLRGSALQVLGELPVENVEDYQSILQVLKRRFDPNEKENQWRVEFRNRKKGKDESVTEFGFALGRIANRAYPEMSHKDREVLVIDQFVEGLPSRDIKRHVKFGHPISLNQALSLATEFESFESGFEENKPEEYSVQNIVKEVIEDTVGKALNEVAQSLKAIAQGQESIFQGLKALVNPVKVHTQLGVPTQFGQNEVLNDNKSRDSGLVKTDTSLQGWRCGQEHSAHDCRFEKRRCHKCRKYGHCSKMCRDKQ